MDTPHVANILIHVVFGSIPLLVGLVILTLRKGTVRHARLGKVYVAAAVVVCATAVAGVLVFRFLPLFAVLSVLVLYQVVSGWRDAQTRQLGPSARDAVITTLGVGLTVALVIALVTRGELTGIIWSGLGPLLVLLTFDSARWAFPRRWFQALWMYENVYKMLASFFGMLSAFLGNTVRFGQPWTRLAPVVLGVFVIAWFFAAIASGRYARRRRRVTTRSQRESVKEHAAGS